ncbi:MAG: hypothetical protein LRS49_02960, partial [Desulfurococcales archaeon]|nr:hypothetical protein [Desulfurococcales archaeon]
MARPTRLHAEMIARAALEAARCCARLRLLCGDPPAATARLLGWLGYNQSQVRSLWRAIPPRRPLSVEVYRYRGVRFRVEVRHTLGPLRELRRPGEPPCPLGALDWLGRPHLFAPRAHRLHVYIAGGLGGSGVHMNAVRVLALMEASSPGSLGEVWELVEGLVWGRLSAGEAAMRLSTLLGRWPGVLERLLPRVPASAESLAALVPPLR